MSRQELCRLCLSRSDNIKIFDEENFEQLPEKISFSLNITVSVSDVRKTLCSFCKTKVNEFYLFKRKCREIEAKQIGGLVKIKSEPVESESDVSSTSKLTDAVDPFLWVPFGNPILIDDLSASLPSSVSPLGKIKIKSEKVDIENDIGIEIKKEVLKSPINPLVRSVKEENPEEDLDKSIDDLINQVVTESDSSGEDSRKSEEAMKQNKSSSGGENPEEKKKSSEEGNSSEKKKDDTSSDEEKRKSLDDDSSSSFSKNVSTRGGRGRKRRGGSVRGGTSKRGRALRSGETPKTPENQPKRLTRSSTGTCPRRKIVDSSDDDGDFNGGDDPDDPEFKTAQTRSKSPTSSSSSSSDEEEPEINKKKIIKKADLSVLLQSAKQEKEEALKRQCPHCKMVYKHWVSYDDHVKNCKGPKDKDGKDKNAPEDDDKERKCVICLIMFKGTRALREHMEVHQPKKGPSHHCKICNENFTSKGGLICHNALKHRAGVTEPIIAPERKKHHCVLCNETFETSGDYICHQVLKHKKK